MLWQWLHPCFVHHPSSSRINFKICWISIQLDLIMHLHSHIIQPHFYFESHGFDIPVLLLHRGTCLFQSGFIFMLRSTVFYSKCLSCFSSISISKAVVEALSHPDGEMLQLRKCWFYMLMLLNYQLIVSRQFDCCLSLGMLKINPESW